MSFSADSGIARALQLTSKIEFAPGGDAPEKPARDLKKVVLITGLAILSWVATYVGMLELIEANMGDLPLTHKVIIGFSVAMLMTMVVWLLDQMFAPVGWLTRTCYIAGYLFLTVISVGFGFGFYWKVLESRAESTRSAESAVTQVQSALHGATTRLEQLDATLVQLATLSHEKAELERTKGTSCPNSKPGDGPRRRMRDEDANRFSFASDFVKGRVTAVKGDMAALNGDLAKVASADASTFDPKTGTRNEFMKGLSRKLDMTVTGFNALRTDPQLRQLRTDLDERAGKSTFGDPGKGGFLCPDPQLQQALRGAVRAIDMLPELEKPEIAAVEGSEATIEAFRRLTATFYGLLSFKMPPSADELRDLQRRAVQSVESGTQAAVTARDEPVGLSKRDYVPLAVAVFVDLCLLLVSIGRPMNRLHGLVPKMRDAERGPVIEILSRFNDIHRDREVRESFELFRHVVFDLNGDYYVAVPLDAPPRLNPHEREQLRLEAQLLSNLFASFEKERIFKRTWTPFTRRVQAKLRKQGSKFAESEAFRVYRFRNGAWSEIILGAVMGAARRAEEERRARSAAAAGRVLEPTLPPFSREPDVPPVPTSASATAAFGAPPARSGERTARPEMPPTANDEPVAAPRRRPRPMPAARFSAFGAYAQRARAEFEDWPEDDEEMPAGSVANNNTARPHVSERSSSVTTAPAPIVEWPAPKAAPASEPTHGPMEEATIGVVLKRETVTIPVPRSVFASSLPSLLARAGTTIVSEPRDAQAHEPSAPPAVEPPPAPLALSAAEVTDMPDEFESPPHPRSGDWEETDVTIARRFKPGAAA